MQERRRVLLDKGGGYSTQYLTFKALERGTFSFSGSVLYSTDDGVTWTSLRSGRSSPTINSGSKIMWKALKTPDDSVGIGCFGSTGNFEVEGNPMSLLYGDNFKEQVDLSGKNYVFKSLFQSGNKLISAKNLSLPATTLSIGCYSNMFYGCTSLTTAPELPATTLAQECYYYMFFGCTSLTTAPELPATTLAEYCYYYMFQGCTSLNTAPSVLPATTLSIGCYSNMFYGCTSLTTAPELPATTLTNGCYNHMFRNCKNLNYIKAMFTTTPNTSYTNNWVDGVASSGTFVKNAVATWNVKGVNGIPKGWTVQNASS